MPPGALSSMVSKGPRNDQRRPSPSFTVRSRSSAEIKPSPTRRNASASSAPCSLFRTKPLISRLIVTGTCPIHREIEVFRRNKAFPDQAECFGEQRALQPVQDKAVDLAVDRDGHLPDLAIDFARTVDCVRRGPRRAAKLAQRYEMRRLDRMPHQATR